jgi:cytochrome c-type biogenesis protein CcmH/NrfF
MKIRRAICFWLLLTLLLAVGAVAQQATAPSPAPQSGTTQSPPQSSATPQQKTEPAPPETAEPDKAQQAQQSPQAEPGKKISKEEAQALFRTVDEILDFASKDTGLPIKHPVKRKLASREEVKKYIEDRMKDDEDTKRLQRSEVVLKKFALVPEQFDLRSFLVDLLKEQVAGFYDSKKKTVFLLDWVEVEAQKPVLAHELTHALQDQNFDLEKWMKAAQAHPPLKGKGAAPKDTKEDTKSAADLMEDERMAARQAVAEGQAMVVLIDYMLAPNGQSVKSNPQIADAVMAGMAATGETPLYTKAPMFLKQLMLFPYQRGLKFETDVLVKAGTEAAFAGAFREPPADSRQILQPETYLNKENLPPMPVPDFEAAAGKQYEKYDLSVMGEFDVWLLAKQYVGQESADAMSPKWRGGYYYAALKPGTPKASNGNPTVPKSAIALAYASKWASADDAEQFAAIYAKYLPKRYKSAKEVGAATPVQGANPSTVKVGIADRLKGVHTWDTDEGTLLIETRGDTMLVMEGFDGEAAARLKAVVFPETAAAK